MINQYFNYLQEVFNKIKLNEEENIRKASELIVNSISNDGRFFVFGTGHSHIIAEEIYLRAGGLAVVEAILPDEVMLHQMPNKSTFIERLSGYSQELLNLYSVSPNDVILIISNSGRNNVIVEMALAAKEKGMKVIGITSLEHSKNSPSRHTSGKRLFELCDVTINNHAPIGDANFEVGKHKVGAVSTFTGSAIVQALVTNVVAQLDALNIDVPIFKSSNIDNAQEYNDNLFVSYYGKK